MATRDSVSQAGSAPLSPTSFQSMPRPSESTAERPRTAEGFTTKESPTFVTGHDKALAELFGMQANAATGSGTPFGASGVSKGLSGDDTPDEGSGFQSPINRSTSAAPTNTTATSSGTSVPGDILYDPFTGTELGQLHDAGEDAGAGAPRDDVLWTHLARVLALQSDIAAMHVRMESIGAEAPDERGKGKGKPRSPRAPAWGDEVGEDIDIHIGAQNSEEEAAQNRQREEEFAKLSGKFTGRKEAIDKIMGKLNELSHEVTAFHSLVTPTVDFSASSRKNSAAGGGDDTSKTTPQSTSVEHGAPPSPQESNAEQTSSMPRPPVFSPGTQDSARPNLLTKTRTPGDHEKHRGVMTQSPVSMARTENLFSDGSQA